jgi:hypothetical protein
VAITLHVMSRQHQLLTQQRPAIDRRMIRLSDHLVLAPQVSPVEARVVVLCAWTSDAPVTPSNLRLAGRIGGPWCEYAQTLSSWVPLRVEPSPPPVPQQLRATALIMDPCFWEPQHPFCYEVELELHDESGLVDERRFRWGICHVSTSRGQIWLNNHRVFLHGVRRAAATTAAELQAWRLAECDAWLAQATPELCELTDRWGPMLLAELPDVDTDPSAAWAQVERLRNHPSIGVWVLPESRDVKALRVASLGIRQRDLSRPIGVIQSASAMGIAAPDIRLVRTDSDTLPAPTGGRPCVVLWEGRGGAVRPDRAVFRSRITELRDCLSQHQPIEGVIL